MTPVVVDALGTFCPAPVRMLARALERVPPGTEVELLADDPLVAVDVPAWCHSRGVVLRTFVVEADGTHRAVVVRPQGADGPGSASADAASAPR